MKILKITFLGLLMGGWLLPFQTQAQGLRLGVKVGANLNQTSGDALSGDFSGYFLGGLYGGVKMSKIRIQAEALFSQTTMTTGPSFTEAFKSYINENKQDVQEGTFKMNELSIPLTIGFNIVPKLLWLEAGPQYTAVVSVKDVDDFLKESERVFKKGYVSGLIGLSIELPVSLNAGVRYVMGFSDRNNTDIPDHWRTNHIQIHVGYSFIK